MSAWVGIGRSDIGLVRRSNQERLAGTFDHLGFWAVADGMGGTYGGDISAQTAVATVKGSRRTFCRAFTGGTWATEPNS